MSKDNNYLAILLEEIRDQNKALLEGQAALSSLLPRTGHLEESAEELKQDVKIIKAVATDTSKQVHNHERRIPRLERHLRTA